jgi:dihydropteroate synthase
VMAVERGASIVCVHDVKATVDVLKVAAAVMGADPV